MRWWHRFIKQIGVARCDECDPGYRYYNRRDKVCVTRIEGYEFENDQIKIQKDGLVTIKRDAGSDGCTPCFLLFGASYWGIPNGPVRACTQEPVTARAFFLHDWLLNTRHESGIPVELIHQAFCDEISDIERYWAKPFYCPAVKLFGPKR